MTLEGAEGYPKKHVSEGLLWRRKAPGCLQQFKPFIHNIMAEMLIYHILSKPSTGWNKLQIIPEST